MCHARPSPRISAILLCHSVPKMPHMMMFVGSLRDASIRMADLRSSDWLHQPSFVSGAWRVIFAQSCDGHTPQGTLVYSVLCTSSSAILSILRSIFIHGTGEERISFYYTYLHITTSELWSMRTGNNNWHDGILNTTTNNTMTIRHRTSLQTTSSPVQGYWLCPLWSYSPAFVVFFFFLFFWRELSDRYGLESVIGFLPFIQTV